MILDISSATVFQEGFLNIMLYVWLSEMFVVAQLVEEFPSPFTGFLLWDLIPLSP
jgi:hypothetical protein